MKTYATCNEFLAAFAALADQEKMGLEAYASRCSNGTEYSDSMDLIHEAVARVADGRRKWPRNVDLADFIAGCVKSIASASKQRRSMLNKSMDWLSEEEEGNRTLSHEAVESAEESAIRNERRRMGAEAVEFARGLLAEDFDGIRVLNGMVADISPKDMRQAFNLDARAFNAARQRVTNRLKIWAERHPGY